VRRPLSRSTSFAGHNHRMIWKIFSIFSFGRENSPEMDMTPRVSEGLSKIGLRRTAVGFAKYGGGAGRECRRQRRNEGFGFIANVKRSDVVNVPLPLASPQRTYFA
jgi:hypothetical protein